MFVYGSIGVTGSWFVAHSVYGLGFFYPMFVACDPIQDVIDVIWLLKADHDMYIVDMMHGCYDLLLLLV